MEGWNRPRSEFFNSLGYEPTSGDPPWNVRLGPGSRHCGARSRPPFLGGTGIPGFPYSCAQCKGVSLLGGC